MSTIVLEPANEADADLLLNLARRLGVKATVSPEATMSAEERARRFEAVAGSWQSEETGDDLNQQLRAARYFRDREVEL